MYLQFSINNSGVHALLEPLKRSGVFIHLVEKTSIETYYHIKVSLHGD
jgi:hypothetical protein